MEQPRNQTTGRFVQKDGASSAGGHSGNWIEKVKAHWLAMKAKNPSYTYKQALIAMKHHN